MYAVCYFPGDSDGKVSVYNVGDLGSIPESGRYPGEGNGTPVQYPCLENPMDRGAWCPWGRKESDTTERLHVHVHPDASGWIISLFIQVPKLFFHALNCTRHCC